LLIGTNIAIEGHKSTIVSDTSNQFASLLYYSSGTYSKINNSSKTMVLTAVMPKLSISNLTIEGFDGGAMSFDGDIDLELSTIVFRDDHSLFSGGAIAVTHNTYRSNIYNCSFINCYASGKNM
jgi:hypothetical protein